LEIRFNVGFLGNDVPLSMWNKDVLDNPHAFAKSPLLRPELAIASWRIW